MSSAGSRFSSGSAHGPSHDGIRGTKRLDLRNVMAAWASPALRKSRAHFIHRPAKDVLPPWADLRVERAEAALEGEQAAHNELAYLSTFPERISRNKPATKTSTTTLNIHIIVIQRSRFHKVADTFFISLPPSCLQSRIGGCIPCDCVSSVDR